jgi:hypothetical protein
VQPDHPGADRRWFVCGDLPDVWMLLGCTLIVASGLFVFYREAVLGKR